MVGAGAVALSGCMTVSSGEYGVALDDSGHPRNPTAIGEPMKISAGELGPLSSLYFGVVEVTFENTSEVEPLVMLRYFGPEVNPEAPAMGAYRKNKF